MSVPYLLIRTPSEKAGAFNLRLRQACSLDEDPITDFQLDVVDGLPAVTLVSELVEATEEDVENKEEDDDFKLGDMISAGDRLAVQVARLEATTDPLTQRTQNIVEKMFGRFNGDVVKTVVAKGLVPVLLPLFGADGKESGVKYAALQEVCYIGIAYVYDDGEDGDEEDGKGG
jgi:hypothetical protein